MPTLLFVDVSGARPFALLPEGLVALVNAVNDRSSSPFYLLSLPLLSDPCSFSLRSYLFSLFFCLTCLEFASSLLNAIET
jgi:hypothetical protein